MFDLEGVGFSAVVFHEFGDDACDLLRCDEEDASLEGVASASAFEDDVQVCPESLEILLLKSYASM